MNVTGLRVGNITHNNVETRRLTKADLAFLLTKGNEHFAEPVEIDEGWLRKIGFTNLFDNETWIIFCFGGQAIRLDKHQLGYYPSLIQMRELSSDKIQEVSLNKINYVHQLQNLWHSITGEELDFEI